MKLKRKYNDTKVLDQLGYIQVLTPPEEVFVPSCAHGPMILFQRKLAPKPKSESQQPEEESGREEVKAFFACSAYRDRKLCSAFFSLDDKKLRNESLIRERAEIAKIENVRYDHKVLFKNYRELSLIDAANRKFCKSCNLFMKRVGSACGTKDCLDVDHSTCLQAGSLITGIPEEFMRKPLKLFSPQSCKTAEAQFYFAPKSLNVLVSWVDKYENVLGIGTPSVVFDILSKVTLTNYTGSIKNCFCLDIDWKLCQIFAPKNFAQFNLCNQFFFSELGAKSFDKFLAAANGGESNLSESRNACVIIDPPYGVKMEIIANLVSYVMSKVNCDVIICLPYFMESAFLSCEKLKQFSMCDYRVEYESHRVYSGEKKRGSPARFFTNIDLKKFVLPLEDGYRLCTRCKKYVHQLNKHCRICDLCCTKDGPTYVHCKKCKSCVKSTFFHCTKCDACHLENSKCLEKVTKPVVSGRDKKKMAAKKFAFKKSSSKKKRMASLAGES